MATLGKGVTFGSSDTVTGTKLNNLVDNGTVSDIAQGDIEANSGLTVRSTTQPSDTDALWYDTTNNVLKAYDGSDYAEVGSTPKYIAGLQLANNGVDATNDIDVSTGSANDSTDVLLMTLSSAFTKQIDATFAEGTAAGGRDSGDNLTGAKWFRVYLIGDTTAAKSPDIFISTSDSPTMPTGWDVFRRIGHVRWDGSALVLFYWDGDSADPVVQYDEPVISDLNDDETPATSFTDVDLSAGAPPSARRVNIRYQFGDSNGATAIIYYRNNGSSSTLGVINELDQINAAGATAIFKRGFAWVACDSSQIIEYAAASGDGGTNFGYSIWVFSYVDRR